MARRVQDRDAQRERNRKARERAAAASTPATRGTPANRRGKQGLGARPVAGTAATTSLKGRSTGGSPFGSRRAAAKPAKSNLSAAERRALGTILPKEFPDPRGKADKPGSAAPKKAAPKAATKKAAPKKAAPKKAAPKAASFSAPSRKSGEKMVQHRLRVQKARQAFNRKKRLS